MASRVPLGAREMSSPNQADLATLKELVGTGAITPLIDRAYGLDDVPEALRYLSRGHARGKVVIDTGGSAGPS